MVIRATALHDDEDQAKKLLEPMLTCPTLDAAKVKIIAARTSLPEEYEQQIADNPTGR